MISLTNLAKLALIAIQFAPNTAFAAKQNPSEQSVRSLQKKYDKAEASHLRAVKNSKNFKEDMSTIVKNARRQNVKLNRPSWIQRDNNQMTAVVSVLAITVSLVMFFVARRRSVVGKFCLWHLNRMRRINANVTN